MKINLVSPSKFQEMCRVDAEIRFSILLCGDFSCPDSLQLYVADFECGVSARILATISYLEFVLEIMSQSDYFINSQKSKSNLIKYILFQAGDEPGSGRSVSWQARKSWSSLYLIPDLYYFDNRGYSNFLPRDDAGCPDWQSRKSAVIWRGSTTGWSGGALGIDPDSIYELPRYRLCSVSKTLSDAADIGFSSIVQVRLPGSEIIIREILNERSLLKDFVPFKDMSQYKLTVDIDGNANSWNFISKLKLGSCILKVESSWKQWFNDRLIPWRHYVPVREDLEDFQEKVDWCLSHDAAASRIAFEGRELGLSMEFETEMAQAAVQFFRAAETADVVL